eukprot:sb/3476863/
MLNQQPDNPLVIGMVARCHSSQQRFGKARAGEISKSKKQVPSGNPLAWTANEGEFPTLVVGSSRQTLSHTYPPGSTTSYCIIEMNTVRWTSTAQRALRLYMTGHPSSKTAEMN